MTVGRALPTSMFIMWCKKCWQFLECAEINKASGAKSKSVAKVKGAVKDSGKLKSQSGQTQGKGTNSSVLSGESESDMKSILENKKTLGDIPSYNEF